jgi:dienelactone hydrolase
MALRAIWPVVLAAVVLAGCGAGGAAPASTPADTGKPKAGAECADLVAGGKQASFTDSGGASVAGVELGTGKVGVVLAHQNNSNLCEWMFYGRQLVRRGYHVLAFDFPGEGASGPRDIGTQLDRDVVAAAEYLRGHGASTLVLMGASKGGTASLVAATEIQPPVAAVVSLSAPETFLGMNAHEAAATLKVPVLYLATENDTPFADAAHNLYEATPATTQRDIFVGLGGEHGVGLFGSPQASKVTAAIDKLLAAYAPPSP